MQVSHPESLKYIHGFSDLVKVLELIEPSSIRVNRALAETVQEGYNLQLGVLARGSMSIISSTDSSLFIFDKIKEHYFQTYVSKKGVGSRLAPKNSPHTAQI